MCAMLLCALMMFVWMLGGRFAARGRYWWRWSWLKVVVVLILTPEGPASSWVRVEKNSGLPGGALICLE